MDGSEGILRGSNQTEHFQRVPFEFVDLTRHIGVSVRALTVQFRFGSPQSGPGS